MLLGGFCVFPMDSTKARVCALVLWLATIAAVWAADTSLSIRLVEAARQQIGVTTEYDPSYTRLKYPGGDVPLRTGSKCGETLPARNTRN